MENRAELERNGWRIEDYSPSFSPEELHSYYQDIKNGWWEEFCGKIFIPIDKDGSLKKDMISAKNKPEYEWLLERMLKDQIILCLVWSDMSCFISATESGYQANRFYDRQEDKVYTLDLYRRHEIAKELFLCQV